MLLLLLLLLLLLIGGHEVVLSRVSVLVARHLGSNVFNGLHGAVLGQGQAGLLKQRGSLETKNDIFELTKSNFEGSFNGSALLES